MSPHLSQPREGGRVLRRDHAFSRRQPVAINIYHQFPTVPAFSRLLPHFPTLSHLATRGDSRRQLLHSPQQSPHVHYLRHSALLKPYVLQESLSVIQCEPYLVLFLPRIQYTQHFCDHIPTCQDLSIDVLCGMVLTITSHSSIERAYVTPKCTLCPVESLSPCQ